MELDQALANAGISGEAKKELVKILAPVCYAASKEDLEALRTASRADLANAIHPLQNEIHALKGKIQNLFWSIGILFSFQLLTLGIIGYMLRILILINSG